MSNTNPDTIITHLGYMQAALNDFTDGQMDNEYLSGLGQYFFPQDEVLDASKRTSIYNEKRRAVIENLFEGYVDYVTCLEDTIELIKRIRAAFPNHSKTIFEAMEMIAGHANNFEMTIDMIRETNDEYLVHNDLSRYGTKINRIYDDVYAVYVPEHWAINPARPQDNIKLMQKCCFEISRVSGMLADAHISHAQIKLGYFYSCKLNKSPIAFPLHQDQVADENVFARNDVADDLGCAHQIIILNSKYMAALDYIAEQVFPRNAHQLGLPKRRPA